MEQKELGKNLPKGKASADKTRGSGLLLPFACLVFLYYNQDIAVLGLTCPHWA